MTEKIFGPEYSKIDTAFNRDARGTVIPEEWASFEFGYLADNPWTWAEKIDGTNMRLHWNGSRMTIGGRTDDAQLPAPLVAHLMKLSDPESWRRMFPDADDVTIYGEGYGTGIRSGGQYRPDVDMIIFDVRIGGWWLRDESIAEVAGGLGQAVVPPVGTFTLNEAWEKVKAGELTSNWPKARIEGIVGRPEVPLFTRKGDRIITKLKLKDWQDYQRSKER